MIDQDFDSYWQDDLQKQLSALSAVAGDPAAAAASAAAGQCNPESGNALSAQGAEPPEASITGGSNSQSCSPGVSTPGGVDWLSAPLYGSWNEANFKRLVEQLEALQHDAREKDGGAFFESPDGDRVYVRPYSLKRGIWHFHYALETQGMVILISKRATAEKSPNCLVDIGSMTLMQVGHEVAFANARRFLERLGWRYEKAHATRCDLCVDLPGVPVEWFAERYLAGAYVSRAVDDQYFRKHRKVTGIVFGKGIRCRIYDKLLETADNPAKRAVMVAYRWNGETPECATRVEFQLRRDEMREEFSCTDIYDLFAKLRTISERLSKDWLRFTAEVVDRDNGHQSRADVAERWGDVVAKFGLAFPAAAAEAPPKPPVVPDKGRLLAQALGCVKSAMAQGVAEFTSQDEAIGVLWDWLQLLVPAKFWKDVNERAAELRQRQPLIGVLGTAAGQVPF